MGKTQQQNQQSAEENIESRIALNRQLEEFDYMKIRQNTDLSEEAKRRLLTEKYRERLDGHNNLVAERRRLRGEVREDIESRVFNLPTSKDPSLRLQEHLAFRDAADRVRRAEKPEDLEALVGVAKLSGDTILRHAAFVSAHHAGWNGVLDKIFEGDPAKAADYQTYKEAQSQQAASKELAENLFDATGVPKPTELS